MHSEMKCFLNGFILSHSQVSFSSYIVYIYQRNIFPDTFDTQSAAVFTNVLVIFVYWHCCDTSFVDVILIKLPFDKSDKRHLSSVF